MTNQADYEMLGIRVERADLEISVIEAAMLLDRYKVYAVDYDYGVSEVKNIVAEFPHKYDLTLRSLSHSIDYKVQRAGSDSLYLSIELAQSKKRELAALKTAHEGKEKLKRLRKYGVALSAHTAYVEAIDLQDFPLYYVQTLPSGSQVRTVDQLAHFMGDTDEIELVFETAPDAPTERAIVAASTLLYADLSYAQEQQHHEQRRLEYIAKCNALEETQNKLAALQYRYDHPLVDLSQAYLLHNITDSPLYYLDKNAIRLLRIDSITLFTTENGVYSVKGRDAFTDTEWEYALKVDASIYLSEALAFAEYRWCAYMRDADQKIENREAELKRLRIVTGLSTSVGEAAKTAGVKYYWPEDNGSISEIFAIEKIAGHDNYKLTLNTNAGASYYASANGFEIVYTSLRYALVVAEKRALYKNNATLEKERDDARREADNAAKILMAADAEIKALKSAPPRASISVQTAYNSKQRGGYYVKDQAVYAVERIEYMPGGYMSEGYLYRLYGHGLNDSNPVSYIARATETIYLYAELAVAVHRTIALTTEVDALNKGQADLKTQLARAVQPIKFDVAAMTEQQRQELIDALQRITKPDSESRHLFRSFILKPLAENIGVATNEMVFFKCAHCDKFIGNVKVHSTSDVLGALTNGWTYWCPNCREFITVKQKPTRFVPMYV